MEVSTQSLTNGTAVRPHDLNLFVDLVEKVEQLEAAAAVASDLPRPALAGALRELTEPRWRLAERTWNRLMEEGNTAVEPDPLAELREIFRSHPVVA